MSKTIVFIRAKLAKRSSLHTRIIAGLVLIPASVLSAGFVMGFRWARTPSIPPGIYRLTRNTADPLVTFCPTGDVSIESVARHYREEAWTCPDHYAPLLKPIAARPGDVVTVTHQQISVNGQPLRNTKSFAFDREHKPMHQWPEGTYTVAPGTFWVLSTYNIGSYDSRYYGPITIASILNYGHPVWQFSK
jgi:conjugative transfer signal peptidase TraF